MSNKTPDEAVGTPSIIGQVIRALRTARGIGVNQLGNAVGLEPANLSRFERGIPGGVHPAKYLDTIAAKLGTSGSILYAIAEMAVVNPAILKDLDELPIMVDKLTWVIKHYSKLPKGAREEIDEIIKRNI